MYKVNVAQPLALPYTEVGSSYVQKLYLKLLGIFSLLLLKKISLLFTSCGFKVLFIGFKLEGARVSIIYVCGTSESS